VEQFDQESALEDVRHAARLIEALADGVGDAYLEMR
jgi:hypothetical protein